MFVGSTIIIVIISNYDIIDNTLIGKIAKTKKKTFLLHLKILKTLGDNVGIILLSFLKNIKLIVNSGVTNKIYYKLFNTILCIIRYYFDRCISIKE